MLEEVVEVPEEVWTVELAAVVAATTTTGAEDEVERTTAAEVEVERTTAAEEEVTTGAAVADALAMVEEDVHEVGVAAWLLLLLLPHCLKRRQLTLLMVFPIRLRVRFSRSRLEGDEVAEAAAVAAVVTTMLVWRLAVWLRATPVGPT